MTADFTACLANLERLDWATISQELDAEGYAMLPGVLGADTARALAHDLVRHPNTSATQMTLEPSAPEPYERHDLGPTLPPWLETWRAAMYLRLAPVANRWNALQGVEYRYPAELQDFLQDNQRAGQTRPLSHLSRVGANGHIALHQHDEGKHVFPLQIVAVLSEPGHDFTGGEFVMTEQRPRMQSRPMVLPLQLGDAAIIATGQRPFKGASGYYRVNTKHAVSRVHHGERIGLALLFHHAP